MKILVATTITTSRSGGTAKAAGTDVTWTASGNSFTVDFDASAGIFTIA